MSGIKQICGTCKNCITPKTKNQVVMTEHFSKTSYDNKSFDEPYCRITATGLRNVSKCSHYNEKKTLEKLN